MTALFLVATPIGNLNDISERALNTLRRVGLIACEDTRHTIKLLNHFDIQKPLTSYHDFNEERKAEELVSKIQTGIDVALVSDAGTPLISDPGFKLVRLCRERGISVIAIPGPNAAIAALSASGLPPDEFMFIGFPPAKKKARLDKFSRLQNLTCTLVMYEAPHRVKESLEDLINTLGDRTVCIGREITKIHEEYLFGKISEVMPNVRERGEFVIVVEGAKEAKPERPLTRQEALKRLGLTRNQLYDLFFRKGV